MINHNHRHPLVGDKTSAPREEMTTCCRRFQLALPEVQSQRQRQLKWRSSLALALALIMIVCRDWKRTLAHAVADITMMASGVSSNSTRRQMSSNGRRNRNRANKIVATSRPTTNIFSNQPFDHRQALPRLLARFIRNDDGRD